MQRTSASAMRPVLRSTVVRRQFAHKPVRRAYATAADSQQAGSSHLAAGVAGGAVVLGVGYGYYHFSGAKTAVNSVSQVTRSAKDMKDKAVQSAPSPQAMLGFVRSAVHSYAAAIPGAAYLVDNTFDQLDKIAKENGPEVEKIVKKVYSDISKAAQQGGDKATDQMIAAIQEAVSQIQKLSTQGYETTLKPYMDKNPQLKSAINESLDQLSQFSEKYGPEAKKISDDAVKKVKQMADKGLNGQSIAEATKLLQEKVKEIKELGNKASSDVYKKAAEGAKPYLDKAPDAKKYLEEKVESLRDYVGEDGIKLINSTYEELEKAGKKGDTKQLMKIVKEKMEELQKLAKEKGGDIAGKASEKATQLPGADKLLGAVPGLSDLSQLKQLAQEKGGDYEKLLKETVEELKELLEKKGQKAKDLSKDTAKQAKDTASK